MKTVKISLNSIDKVKSFVNDITKFDYDFDLVSGRYVIDAKSIMGIFSLDLSKPIDLNIHAEDNVDEVLEDYRILLDEKKFDVTFPAAAGPAEEKAYVDRRGLYFILSQIISNAVKYSGEDPTLEISFSRSGYELMLRIRNSGMGVRSCDLPHIFEKGFTGGTGDGRKNATGMGLYLAKGVAGEMNLKLEAASEWGKGFEIRVSFPGVD